MSRKTFASKFARKHTAHTDGHNDGILTRAVRGLLAGLAASAVCLLIATFICLSSDDPDKILLPSALACETVGFIAAGFVASRRGVSLWSSFLSGMAMTVIFCLISLFFGTSASASVSAPISILIRATLIGLSVLGGLASKNIGTKSRRTRRF